MKDRLAGFLNTSLGGVWCQAEQALHINILDLRAAKFGNFYILQIQTVHVKMDNHKQL